MAERKGYSLVAHGRRWYVRFYVESRLCQKPLAALEGTTRGEAETQAAAFVARYRERLERARASRQHQNPIALTWDHLSRRSESYQHACGRYQDRFDEFFREVDLRTLTREDVERWRDWLLKEAPRHDRRPGRLSPKLVVEHLCWLSAVYKRAGLPNPCHGVEHPKKTHAQQAADLEYFTPREVGQLLDACRQVRPDFYNALVFLIYTGCRTGGLYGLANTPADIDPANRAVWVTEKGEKRRMLRLSGPAAPAWQAVAAQRRGVKPGAKLWPQHRMWVYDALSRVACAAFGSREVRRNTREGGTQVRRESLRKVHPHMLRHTLASMALLHFRPAWDIAYLAKWLGHRDISTTYKIYGHWIAPEPPSSWKIPFAPKKTCTPHVQAKKR